MSVCYNCGGVIEFRKVGGVVTPIHLTGGCGQDSYDPSEWSGFRPLYFLYFTSLKYESYVNPNARCPVCYEQVFFYQSEDGGRVFFDALGPPWPKHPCTDKSLRNKVVNVEAKELSPEEAYKWQKEGWEPFLCTGIEQNEGGTTRVTGSMKSQKKSWTLYFLGTCPGIGKYPLLIKPIAPDQGKYQIATFNLSKRKGIQEIYLDCKLPESQWKK